MERSPTATRICQSGLQIAMIGIIENRDQEIAPELLNY